MIRVMLCDVSPVVIGGMQEIFRTTHDISVVATSAPGSDPLPLLRRHDPDLVIADRRDRSLDILTIAQAIRDQRRRARLVLLTGTLGDGEILTALRLGVRGFLHMTMEPSLILTCLRSVQAGQVWMESPNALRSLPPHTTATGPSASGHPPLTPRELVLARLVSQGLPNQEIAKAMGIREGTVKVHLHRVYRKLGLANRVALVVHARDHGLS